MAQLTGINQDNNNCAESDGGIKQSYGLDFNDLGSVTYDGSSPLVVSAITITGAGITFAKFVYDDDDTAFYNQEGERDNKKHTYNQQANMKFSGLTDAKISAAEALKELCATFWIHVLNGGMNLLQGIEKDAGTSGFVRPKSTAKATVSINSDTGDNEDNITVVIDSVAKKALSTSLTTSAIEALTGA